MIGRAVRSVRPAVATGRFQRDTSQNEGVRPMWGMHGGMESWMVLMPVSWALFFALVVYLVARASGLGSERRDRPYETPRDVAKRRYASGEIGDEELKRIL